MRFRKIISILLIVVLSFVLIFNVYTSYRRLVKKEIQPTFLGFSSAVVISGSMEPAINIGDYIIGFKHCEYKKGDIIIFLDGNSAVTHRIYEIEEGGYITKGDANNTVDTELVLEENVVGKVILKIPKMGNFLGFIQTPIGMLILAIAGVLLIFAVPVKMKK